MNLKEINSRAGSISDYLGYIILLFVWSIVNYSYSMLIPASSSAAFQLVPWGLKLLVGPIIFAIIYGGIYERQTLQDDLERKNFFSHIKMHVLRFISAQLLSILFCFIVMMIAVAIAGQAALKFEDGSLPSAILTATFSTLTLFWFSAMVIEPKLFRSLIHALKMLLFNPVALAIAFLWAAVCVADSLAFDAHSERVPLYVNLVRSGVFAVLKTFAVMYILVIYKNAWGDLIQRAQAAKILAGVAGSSTSRPGEGLAKASLGFTFFSFLPPLHLVALILGVVSLKRSQRFILKSAIACCVGGFFTILFALLVAGYFAGQTSSVQMPGYSFLANGNADIQPSIDLLDQGAFEDVEAKLGDTSANTESRDWRIDTALALAKYKNNNMDGALKDFYSALQKKPERSEFYFYYGLALLKYDNAEMANKQFQLALAHEPKLEIAKQYVDLVQNIYEPSKIDSALMYLVILLFLFTVHEYGHAFAAWKLGDDTAKNQGRLTLNPIVHLDLVGSILLPAILLFQQSEFFFGWARPVPIDPRNFKNPDKDHMLVSFAGPAVNLLVAMVCMLILVVVVLLTRLLWPGTLSLNLADPFSAASMIGSPFAKWILLFIVFLKKLFYTSLILGFFNLLPIPPLDGSWILAGFLPERFRGIFDYVRRFGFMLFILLTLTPVFGYYLSIPIDFAWIGLSWIVSAMGFA